MIKSIDLKIKDTTAKYDYSCPKATNAERKISSYLDSKGEFHKESILRREIDYAKFFLKRWDINCCGEHLELESETKVILINKEFEEFNVIEIPKNDDCIMSYFEPKSNEEEVKEWDPEAEE